MAEEQTKSGDTGEIKPATEGIEKITAVEGRSVYGNNIKPFNLPSWNLQMALAWIIWRSPAALRELPPDYRPETWVYDVISRPMEHPTDDVPGNAGHDARVELWTKLNANILSATGICCRTGERQVIDADEWQADGLGYRALDDTNWESDEIGIWGKAAKYHGVRLRRKHMLKIWPPRKTTEVASAALPRPKPGPKPSEPDAAWLIQIENRAKKIRAERAKLNLPTSDRAIADILAADPTLGKRSSETIRKILAGKNTVAKRAGISLPRRPKSHG